MYICTHLNDVLLELGGHGLLELGSHAGDLVFVRAPLKCWENRLVDLGAEVALVLDNRHRWRGNHKKNVNQNTTFRTTEDSLS